MNLPEFGNKDSFVVAQEILARLRLAGISIEREIDEELGDEGEVLLFKGKRLEGQRALVFVPESEFKFWHLMMNLGPYEVADPYWTIMGTGPFSAMLQRAIGSMADELAQATLSDMEWAGTMASIPGGMPSEGKNS